MVCYKNICLGGCNMKKDILKLGMKIVKNTAIKLAERDA